MSTDSGVTLAGVSVAPFWARARVGTSSRFLTGILAVSMLLRVALALYQGNVVTDLPGIYDQISYHGLAVRVLDGHGFSFAEGHWPATRAGEPTAHWSYLYTLYLAGVYALVGVQPIFARLLQAVVTGLLHPWLTWRIGRRVFGERVGLLASGLTALYAYFFYYAGGLLTEAFYIVGLLWTVDAALRIADAARGTSPDNPAPVEWRLWIELGLAVGVTGMLRQAFLVWAPVLYLWLLWNVGGRRFLRWRQAVVGLAATTLVVALMIAPWTLRNYRAFGTFTPLNTNAGFAFYWGNHPIHGVSFMPLLPVDGPSYLDLIPPELRSLNEADLDRALLKAGLAIVAEDPVRFLRLSTTRAKEYFKFWPSADSGTVSNVARVGSFGLYLPFMAWGVWHAARRVVRRPEGREAAAVTLLWLFAAGYTLMHLLTWTLIRYRLPVDAVLVIFAALAVSRLLHAVGFRDDASPSLTPSPSGS